jgi:hypothetical protein
MHYNFIVEVDLPGIFCSGGDVWNASPPIYLVKRGFVLREHSLLCSVAARTLTIERVGIPLTKSCHALDPIPIVVNPPNFPHCAGRHTEIAVGT